VVGLENRDVVDEAGRQSTEVHHQRAADRHLRGPDGRNAAGVRCVVDAAQVFLENAGSATHGTDAGLDGGEHQGNGRLGDREVDENICLGEQLFGARIVTTQSADHLDARLLRQPGHHRLTHLAVRARDEHADVRRRALVGPFGCILHVRYSNTISSTDTRVETGPRAGSIRPVFRSADDIYN
jgi:hypothetical protein